MLKIRWSVDQLALGNLLIAHISVERMSQGTWYHITRQKITLINMAHAQFRMSLN